MQSFEATPEEIASQPDRFIEVVFADLASEFMVMPRGQGFVEYPLFAEAYEHLKRASADFTSLEPEALLHRLSEFPLGFIVFRSVLGFTPSEWAYAATESGGADVPQGFARVLDREIRLSPRKPLNLVGLKLTRVRALVEAACKLLREGAPKRLAGRVHRLDKADTAEGLESVRHLAGMGAPYAMLLYERFLGRPFAGHRDSVSELVGDALESAIEVVLAKDRISFRKTKRAERVPGFDQAPDFIIPDEFNPQVVIEAKITEDDGTARDKVTRVQHLAEIGRQRGFQVVACIGGRGFRVRREDMRKLLLATSGKVFTVPTLPQLVTHTELRRYARPASPP